MVFFISWSLEESISFFLYSDLFILGSRVTDDILRLVPNVESFRTALRCVKVWAKARAIYSNVMGFFGGVAWAIVVARICQMFPNATAASIVSKFFRIMHEWYYFYSHNFHFDLILYTFLSSGPGRNQSC